MPWRGERDPYRIWLSEVILQQTRVEQGRAYYQRFLRAFPRVVDLARASEREVLTLWQGLGYYSRARNLHRAARVVAEELGGEFPRDYAGLLALPGVGPYTAAAIASFAYGLPTAVVDGNVYRVLARQFAIDEPIDKPAGRRRFAELANRLLDEANPGAYNQALMDFGATVCTPRRPTCAACPFADACAARAAGRVAELPRKAGKAARRTRYLDYVHVRDSAGRLLLRERGGGDIWQGLFDFPGVETPDGFAERERVAAELSGLGLKAVGLGAPSPPVKHVLSHQELRARFWRVELAEEKPGLATTGLVWVAPRALANYAVPRLIDRYLAGPGLF